MIGHGFTLSGSTSGTVGKITNIDWSGLIADDIETTDFDSPTDTAGNPYKEYEAGFVDGGELTGDLKLDRTLMSTLRDAFGVKETWTLTGDDSPATVLIGNGYIKQQSMSVPMADQVMTPISIKFSGRPHFPSSSSSSSSSSST